MFLNYFKKYFSVYGGDIFFSIPDIHNLFFSL